MRHSNSITMSEKWTDPEYRQRMSLVHSGKTQSAETIEKRVSKLRGENNWMWISDRSLIVGRQNRNNSEYKQWRMKVWSRDSFRCRISNEDCDGKIEAHHILGWADHPELRYQINNGITLCHAHHPRKVAEVKRLVPVFQELVTASN